MLIPAMADRVEEYVQNAPVTQQGTLRRALELSDNTSPLTGAVVTQAALAEQINQEHELAHQAAETAVQHAVRCGELLLSVKARLKHGEFMPWTEQNCQFEYSTAKRYMKAAEQIATDVAISRLSDLFGQGHNHRAQGGVDHGDVDDVDDAEPEPKPPAKLTLQAPAVTAKAPAATVHTADHAGGEDHHHHGDVREQVVGDAGHVDDDDNPETIRAFQERDQLAALLLAWTEASLSAKEHFLAVHGREIAAIGRKWRDIRAAA